MHCGVLGSFAIVIACAACAPAARSASDAPRTEAVGPFLLSHALNPLTLDTAHTLSSFDEHQNGMLGWWCLDNGLAVLVGLSGPVGTSPTRVYVRVAFDTLAPSAEDVWLVQRQGGFPLAYLQPDSIDSFTQRALRSSEVRLSVLSPANNAIVTYRFDVNGLAEGLGHLSCAERFADGTKPTDVRQ